MVVVAVAGEVLTRRPNNYKEGCASDPAYAGPKLGRSRSSALLHQPHTADGRTPPTRAQETGGLPPHHHGPLRHLKRRIGATENIDVSFHLKLGSKVGGFDVSLLAAESHEGVAVPEHELIGQS